jgi:hypothetical protein
MTKSQVVGVVAYLVPAPSSPILHFRYGVRATAFACAVKGQLGRGGFSLEVCDTCRRLTERSVNYLACVVTEFIPFLQDDLISRLVSWLELALKQIG